MNVTMVKKRLASGDACWKCIQAEELLKKRGLWHHITHVAWAVEDDPSSEGALLGAEHGVNIAPFFIIEADGVPRVFRSALQLARELNAAFPPPSPSAPAPIVDWSAFAEASQQTAPQEIIAAALERFPTDCAISFSGAEDVVLIDMAIKSGLAFSVFSLDTGRLHPETYQFLDRVRSHYSIDLRLMTPDPATLEPFVRERGLFSFFDEGHKPCCAIRKVAPLKRALSTHRAWITGQRKDQSPTRAELPVAQVDPIFSGAEDAELIKFNPLAQWTSAQVWDYIREHNVPFNPLHKRGFVSIGCEPCTRATHPGEHERAGRWWWEDTTKRECGLHIK